MSKFFLILMISFARLGYGAEANLIQSFEGKVFLNKVSVNKGASVKSGDEITTQANSKANDSL